MTEARPDRLVEYFVTVGIGEQLYPLKKREEPIYDVIVICGRDDPPSGYERIDTTLENKSANLNNANVFGTPTFIAVSRKKRSERDAIVDLDADVKSPTSDTDAQQSSEDDGDFPITDLIVLSRERNEKCPPLYRPIHAPKTQPNSPYGKTIFLAVTKARKKTAIIDIDVVTQYTPSSHPNIVASNKSIAMAMFQEPLFLRLTRYGASPSSLTYKPALLDRFPRTELKASPLPEDVPYFVHPDGITLYDTPTRPDAFASTYVMTTQTGREIYCTAVTFYERCTVVFERSEPILLPPAISRRQSFIHSPTVPPPTFSHHFNAVVAILNPSLFPLLEPVLFDPNPQHSFYAPKTIVLLSYWPFYDCFRVFLTEIYRISLTPPPSTPSFPSSLPIERYLMNLWETPLPRTSRVAVRLTLPTTSITFDRPSSDSFPLLSINFALLFQTLSVSNIVTIIAALLIEKKLILATKDSRLIPLFTPIAEALRALLFPFQWQYSFVPVLPSVYSNILDAPMPIIVGVFTPHVISKLSHTDDLCLVSLDTDTVEVHGKPCPLPETLTVKLKKELEQYAHVDAIRKWSGVDDIVREFIVSRRPNNVTSGQSSFNVVACRAAFLRMFIHLIFEMDECLLYPPFDADHTPSSDELFDLAKFLATSNKAYRLFLHEMCGTQMFSQFIEERTYTSADRKMELNFFNVCMKYERTYYRLSAEHRLGKTTTPIPPNLILHLSQRTSSATMYAVPTPDCTGIDMSRTPLYDTFPKLDIALFRRPRPIAINYMREAAAVVTSNEENNNTLPPATDLTASPMTALFRRGGRRPSNLQLSPPTSVGATKWALSLKRAIYAAWFELQLTCLSQLPPQQREEGITFVFEGLTHMTAQGFTPDEGIYRCVLGICGRFGRPYAAGQIIETMKKTGVKPTAATYGAYTSALAAASSSQSVNDGNDSARQNEAFSFLTTATSPSKSSLSPHSAQSPHSHTRNASGPFVHGGNALPSPDPFRSVAETYQRLLVKAQRQSVEWESLCMAVGYTCSVCSYDMSQGEIIAGWMVGGNKSYSSQCPACAHTFMPTLQIRVTINTRPMKLKAAVLKIRHGITLRTKRRHYVINVLLLCPTVMRSELIQTTATFREDFANVHLFRVMHEVLYWNLLFWFSHPTMVGRINLAFLVDLADSVMNGYRVAHYDLNRIRDITLTSPHSKSGPPALVKRRTISGRKGLRELTSVDGVEPSTPTSMQLSPSMEHFTNNEHSKRFDFDDETVDNNGWRNDHRPPAIATAVDERAETYSAAEARTRRPAQTRSLDAINQATDLRAEDDIRRLLREKSLQHAMRVFLHQRRLIRAATAFTDPLSAPMDNIDERNSPVTAVSDYVIADGIATYSADASANPPAAPMSARDPDAKSILLSAKKSSVFSLILPSRSISNPLKSTPTSSPSTTASHNAQNQHSPESPLSPVDDHSNLVTTTSSASSTSASKPRTPIIAAVAPPVAGVIASEIDVGASANAISKSASAGRIDLKLAPTATLVSLTSMAVSAVRTGTMDDSPTERDVMSTVHGRRAAPVLHKSNSDSQATDARNGRSSQWFPSRSPGVRPWLRPMFDYLYHVGGRYWESYGAFVEAYRQSALQLTTEYRDETTLMDAAPSPQLQAIDTVFGLRNDARKLTSKKSRKSRPINTTKLPAAVTAAAFTPTPTPSPPVTPDSAHSTPKLRPFEPPATVNEHKTRSPAPTAMVVERTGRTESAPALNTRSTPRVIRRPTGPAPSARHALSHSDVIHRKAANNSTSTSTSGSGSGSSMSKLYRFLMSVPTQSGTTSSTAATSETGKAKKAANRRSRPPQHPNTASSEPRMKPSSPTSNS